MKTLVLILVTFFTLNLFATEVIISTGPVSCDIATSECDLAFDYDDDLFYDVYFTANSLCYRGDFSEILDIILYNGIDYDYQLISLSRSGTLEFSYIDSYGDNTQKILTIEKCK